MKIFRDSGPVYFKLDFELSEATSLLRNEKMVDESHNLKYDTLDDMEHHPTPVALLQNKYADTGSHNGKGHEQPFTWKTLYLRCEILQIEPIELLVEASRYH